MSAQADCTPAPREGDAIRLIMLPFYSRDRGGGAAHISGIGRGNNHAARLRGNAGGARRMASAVNRGRLLNQRTRTQQADASLG